MARYLTPSKIGLLVLIELYTFEAIPSDAILPVLSFITSHIIGYDASGTSSAQPSPWRKAERTVALVIGIQDFEKLLGSYPFLMGMPGRRLWDQFLSMLWDIDSLDALHNFFENLWSILVKTKEERETENELGHTEPEAGIKLCRNSPFGVFVRRARLEYQRLRFHDCAELWKAFVRYRQPTVRTQRRRTPGLGKLGFDSVLLVGEQEEWDAEGVAALASVVYGDMLSGGTSVTLPTSIDDIEVLLEFQIEQMQSQ